MKGQDTVACDVKGHVSTLRKWPLTVGVLRDGTSISINNKETLFHVKPVDQFMSFFLE